MNKTDLETGMIVKLRNGKYLMLVRKMLIADCYRDVLLNNDEYVALNDYTLDLLGKHSDFDIVEVYTSIYVPIIPIGTHYLSSLWKRYDYIKGLKTITLTNTDIDTLKALSKSYNYIARDKDNSLCVYKNKPVINGLIWSDLYTDVKIDSSLCKDILWTDAEPYSIKELLNDKLL